MLASQLDHPLPSVPGPRRRLLLLVCGALVLVLALLAVALRTSLPWFGTGEAAVRLDQAFLYQQQRSLSCEYASVHIAATMTGHDVSEYDIEALVPLNENPHKGYRGNILGEWGNTSDYGVYNAPLDRALTELGIPHRAFYGDRGELEAELRAGRPVVVWLGMRGEGYSYDQWDADGDRYQLTTFMHVMTVYGFDDEGVYLTDPGTAVWRSYSWPEFMAMWDVMDGMALAVGSENGD